MSRFGQSYYFAQAYGESTYGSCTYSATTSCSTSAGTGTSGSSSSGGLVNTGVAVVAFVTLACLIMMVAMIVRFWKRAPKAVVEDEEVATSDNSEQDNDSDSQN